MILIIDNYDSFTYNIVQQVGKHSIELDIVKNNKIAVDQINNRNYSHIIISPGPGDPKQAGSSVDIITKFYKKIPILGVCLGHQAIGKAFNCRIVKHSSIYHGKKSKIHHKGRSRLYRGVPMKFDATRYHSLVIEGNSISNDIDVNAWLGDGTIMGVEHKKYPLYGVQFHPESIETKYGDKIIENFIKIV